MILWSIPLAFVVTLIWMWFELRIEDAQVEREADLYTVKQWLTQARLHEVMKPNPDWPKIHAWQAEEDNLK